MWSSFSPVSAVEDQSEPEVGGCVEGAGLSGARRFLCGAGGKRTFAQVVPVGAFLQELQASLLSNQSQTSLCFPSTPWWSTPGIPPSCPAEAAC